MVVWYLNKNLLLHNEKWFLLPPKPKTEHGVQTTMLNNRHGAENNFVLIIGMLNLLDEKESK